MEKPNLKHMRKVDWIERMDPEDRTDHKNERIYRIQENLDVIDDLKGEIAIVLHDNGEYPADTILSKRAKEKLIYLIEQSLNKNGGKKS